MNHIDFVSRPGFVYRIGNQCYYLGKWICLECTDYEVTDCLYMFELAYREQNFQDLNLYFQKLRAYSDFALVPPLDKDGVYRSLDILTGGMTATQKEELENQLQIFDECCHQFLNI